MSILGKITSIFLYFVAIGVHVDGASNNHTVPGPGNKHEALRTCLLSKGVQSISIISRDNSNDSEKYLDLNWQWNTLYGYITPLVYLEAKTPLDVASGVKCSVQSGIRVVAKSGGHSYLKHGFGDADSFVIDLHLMNDVRVQVDEGTRETVATVGPGTRQGKLEADLWAAGGWMLPLGSCPTVGFAGFVLGGGYGHYGRWLGLASDHLVEVTMVDAAGEILTVNNTTDSDLFWALRGGAGGNFGIVTSMQLRLRKAPNHVTSLVVEYSWDQFPELFKSWQAWVASEPPAHLGATPVFDTGNISMTFRSINGTEGEVRDLAYTKFPLPERNVSFSTLEYPEHVVQSALPYWPPESEPLTHISQLVNLTRHNAPGWKRVKSIFVDQEVTNSEDIAKLHSMFLEYVSEYSGLFFEHQGGAISSVGPTETAYMHRGKVLYGAQPLVYAWDGKEPVEAVEAMERFFKGTESIWNHTASYQNYLDQELPDYLERYYGSNLEKLVTVKARVDPENVFHHSKSIPVNLI